MFHFTLWGVLLVLGKQSDDRDKRPEEQAQAEHHQSFAEITSIAVIAAENDDENAQASVEIAEKQNQNQDDPEDHFILTG